MERAGTRDIEGKVTRVGAGKPGGERVSIKKEEVLMRFRQPDSVRIRFSLDLDC